MLNTACKSKSLSGHSVCAAAASAVAATTTGLPSHVRSAWGLARPRNDPFSHLERRMNDLFSLPSIIGSTDLFAPPSSIALSGPFAEGLRVDVTENETSYVVTADIPGVKKEEVTITLKEDILNISGERATATEEKNEQRHVVERSFGRFSRSIRLPADANPESISASA